MNKSKFIIIVIICIIILICALGWIMHKNLTIRTIDKVKMTIVEGSLTKTGATIIIHDKNYEHYLYGEWYRIDKKVNDEWTEMPIINSTILPAICESPNKEGILTMTINWAKIYGPLEEGEYRLVKEVLGQGINYIGIEFKI